MSDSSIHLIVLTLPPTVPVTVCDPQHDEEKYQDEEKCTRYQIDDSRSDGNGDRAQPSHGAYSWPWQCVFPPPLTRVQPQLSYRVEIQLLTSPQLLCYLGTMDSGAMDSIFDLIIPQFNLVALTSVAQNHFGANQFWLCMIRTIWRMG